MFQHFVLVLLTILAFNLFLVLLVILSLETPAETHKDDHNDQSYIILLVPTTQPIAKPTIDKVELKTPAVFAEAQVNEVLLKGMLSLH